VKIIAPLLLALVAVTVTYSQSGNSTREIVLANSAIRAAIESKDKTKLQAQLVDDFSHIGRLGLAVDKSQFIDGIMAPDTAEIPSRVDDLQVRIYGNVAVLTCRVTIVNSTIIGDFSGRLRETNVFVKQRGRWRLASSQETEIHRS
jgi:ketosteroid isomerase-like protein